MGKPVIMSEPAGVLLKARILRMLALQRLSINIPREVRTLGLLLQW